MSWQHIILCIVCALLLVDMSAAQDGIHIADFASDDWTLQLRILDDDLVDVQFSQQDFIDSHPTIMVAKTDYSGPTQLEISENTIITAEIELHINPESLCVTMMYRPTGVEHTTLCPTADEGTLGLSFTKNTTTHLYGLGEQFPRRAGTDGDWMGQRRLSLNLYGNTLVSSNGGNVGNAQFPILYALGAEYDNYGFFFDDVYQQYWDFSGDPFTVSTTNPNILRGYLMSGENLPDLRSDYLELTGRPPVPPRSTFGLWVSEYGYENWDELLEALTALEDAQFPVDGFMLDLYWFGGIGDDSQMGSLSWDTENFPAPAATLAMLREDHGVQIMMIEEPYVAETVSDYETLAAQGILVRDCAEPTCEPVTFDTWWDTGGMVDWSSDEAATFWHDDRRQPLIEAGVVGHWTDLGEPENYSDAAWYQRAPHNQAGIHNLYNFLWAKSIYEGYERNYDQTRPFILSRSGTSGIQRFGASMWSGDIAANMPSLQSQMLVQMHMSLSGIDYFGSDVGGFYRNVADPVIDADTMYTLWLANSALLDVPLRPHAYNVDNVHETSPALVGDVASNLANVRLRYQLLPYLYTFAHHAYRHGEAVFSPLVYHYQADEAVRQLGGEKMIGRDLLMTAITGYVYDVVPVYLPAGGWFNYHTGEFIESAGEWIETPTLIDELRRAPLFVREGAIIPTLTVDEFTMNSSGRRRDGSQATMLTFTIYQGNASAGAFTLIEDDGERITYQSGNVRETPLSFDDADNTTTISIDAAEGTYTNATQARATQITFITNNRRAESITWNGEVLPVFTALDQFESATAGYFVSETGELRIKFGAVDVSAHQEIVVQWLQ